MCSSLSFSFAKPGSSHFGTQLASPGRQNEKMPEKSEVQGGQTVVRNVGDHWWWRRVI